jgi:Icc-related predicted phosphoesterase
VDEAAAGLAETEERGMIMHSKDKSRECRVGRVFILLGVFILVANFVWHISTRTGSDAMTLPPAGEVLPVAKPFTFGVVGDSRRNVAVLCAIMKDAATRRAEFMLHGGDIINAPNRRQYNWVLHELSENRTTVPIYAVPGNHDIDESATDNEVRTRLYRQAFGPRRYWFGCGDVLFVAFDDSMGRCEKEELDWLQQTLVRHRPDFKRCFIFMHMPPYDPRPEEPGHSLLDEDGQKLLKVLKLHDVDAVFASHIHSFTQGSREDIPLYITGGGGADRDDPSEPYHYLLCTVDDDGELTVEKIDMTKPASFYLEYAFQAKWRSLIAQSIGLVFLVAGIVFFLVGRKRTS